MMPAQFCDGVSDLSVFKLRSLKLPENEGIVCEKLDTTDQPYFWRNFLNLDWTGFTLIHFFFLQFFIRSQQFCSPLAS